MTEKSFKIYQFQIFLKYSKPPIWPLTQVFEEYTFEDLYFATQPAEDKRVTA